MTGRELLNRRLWRGKLFVLSGIVIVIFALSAMKVQEGPVFVYAVVITFAGVMLAIAGHDALLTVRCTWCGDSLRQLVYRESSVDHVGFCFEHWSAERTI
jgi:uncharacterized membrane protein YhhN